MWVKSETYRFGKWKIGAVNCERAKGSGKQYWAGFSSYQIIAYLVKRAS